VVPARAAGPVIAADRRAAARAHRAVALPKEQDAAVPPVGIATASERTERTLPPEWWMDRSHCGRDV
jgi:hypothetical protein